MYIPWDIHTICALFCFYISRNVQYISYAKRWWDAYNQANPYGGIARRKAEEYQDMHACVVHMNWWNIKHEYDNTSARHYGNTSWMEQGNTSWKKHGNTRGME